MNFAVQEEFDDMVLEVESVELDLWTVGGKLVGRWKRTFPR